MENNIEFVYYKAVIDKALELAGSRKKLSEDLRCTPNRISEWKRGKTIMNSLIFSRILIYILNKHNQNSNDSTLVIGDLEFNFKEINKNSENTIKNIFDEASNLTSKK